MKTNNSPKAPCLAVFGTGSDVGKSIVVTALCRIFANQGLRVAPFKAQNMSNNSGVTPEGLEMGRAQIVQAEAARIPPHVDMNPVLLKPTSEKGAQVVILGKAVEDRSATEYHEKKKQLISETTAALDRLRDKYDFIIIEGAGSCAEVNLMAHDIVNLPVAEYANAPVLLVADIHRGGVFAQIIGTLACLPENKKDLIAGFLINRFRGDLALFKDGVKWIEERTDKRVFGVLPWYTHINIEAEDSVVIERPKPVNLANSSLPAIAVIRIPHISNFTDFDPLLSLPGLDLFFLEKVQDLSSFVAVILPGSKNTRFDLAWLNTTGWSESLAAYVKQGGHVLGICGGYQMMGQYVHDPEGLEGRPGKTEGLGLLPVETVLKAPKTTTLTKFSWQGVYGSGYEIHMGQTKRLGGEPLLSIHEQNSSPCKKDDGCIDHTSQAMGTYIHGLFDTQGIIKRWLEGLGLKNMEFLERYGLAARDREYDLLAAHFEEYVDIKAITSFLSIH